MDNPNSDKANDVKKTEPKPRVGGGVLTLTREKLVIVIAMAAFALVLLAFVILLTFGGDEPLGILKKNHDHDYEMKIEVVDGKINLIGHCDAKSCEEPDFIKKDVKGGSFTDVSLPTCTSEGKRVYTLKYDGEELKCEVTLPKTGHFVSGVLADEIKDENGYLIYREGIVLSGADNYSCEDVIPAEKAYYVCSVCNAKIGAPVIIPHSVESALVREGGNFFVFDECGKDGCEYEKKTDVTSTVKKVKNTAATCVSKAKIYYECPYGNGTREYVEEYGEVDAENHIFLETSKNADGSYDYKKGVTIPAIGANMTCGKTDNRFHLKCPDCHTDLLDVFGEITVNVKHYYVWKEKVEGTVNPTLTEKGKVSLTCEHKWCKDDAEGHEITVEIEKIITDGENKNAEVTADGYQYTAETEQGVEIKLFIPFSD